jgi:predicted nucleotidyltransferase
MHGNRQDKGIPMKPSQALDAHREEIRKIVDAHQASNPRVFGSVLHGDDTEESDLDVLVDPSATTSLLDIARIQVELENLLRVSVDVLTPNALPEKFRSEILGEARSV